MFGAGDACACRVDVCNATGETMTGYPLFVVLDVYGSYFFAPSFSDYDNYLASHPSFEPGSTQIEVLPEFNWPGGVGSTDGLNWYAAFTDQAITQLFGEMDIWTFGWN
jgi:hypothetical protein